MFQRLTAWLDRFESPSGMLTTSEQAQQDRLRQTRARWIEAVAELHLAQKRARHLEDALGQLEATAREAVRAGRDDLAITVLTRLQGLRPRAAELAQTCAALTAQAATLQQQCASQQAQLSQFRRTRPQIEAAWEADRYRTHLR